MHLANWLKFCIYLGLLNFCMKIAHGHEAENSIMCACHLFLPPHTCTALQGDSEENYVKISNSKPLISPVQWILKEIRYPKSMGLSKVSPTSYKRQTQCNLVRMPVSSRN